MKALTRTGSLPLLLSLLFVSACGSDDGQGSPLDAGPGQSDDADVGEPTTVNIDVIDTFSILQGRSAAAIARHPSTGQIFLSGGLSNKGDELGDILEWTGEDWATVDSGLTEESNHGFVYLPVYDEFVILGNDESVGTRLWNAGTNTTAPLQTFCDPGCGPGGRAGHGMVYFPSEDALLVVSGLGGLNDILQADSHLLVGDDDVWIRTQGPTPPRRKDAAIAYDPSTESVWMFGGEGDDEPLNDLWKLNQNGWQLVQENVHIAEEDLATSSRPAGRTGATLTLHESTGKLILIGGYNFLSGFPEEDTLGYWSLDDGQWQRLTNGRNAGQPDSFRTWDNEHAAIYDPALDAILVVGGAENTGQTRILRLE